MQSLEVVGLGGLVTGGLGAEPLPVDALRCEGGVIVGFDATGDADVVVDAAGAVAIPG